MTAHADAPVGVGFVEEYLAASRTGDRRRHQMADHRGERDPTGRMAELWRSEIFLQNGHVVSPPFSPFKAKKAVIIDLLRREFFGSAPCAHCRPER